VSRLAARAVGIKNETVEPITPGSGGFAQLEEGVCDITADEKRDGSREARNVRADIVPQMRPLSANSRSISRDIIPLSVTISDLL
jgi:hypothetical protein